MSQFSSVATLPNSTFRDSAGHQSGQTPKLSGIIPESVSGHIPESVSGAIPDSVSGSGRNTQLRRRYLQLEPNECEQEEMKMAEKQITPP